MAKPKPAADQVTVHPVPGSFLQGIPAVPTTTDPGTAARLVATGAFTSDAPDDPAPASSLTAEDAAPALAFYHPEG